MVWSYLATASGASKPPPLAPVAPASFNGPGPPPGRKHGPARLLSRDCCAHGGPQGVLAMRPAPLCFAVLGGAALLAAAPAPAPAEALPEKYQTVVAKGLDWLARNQSRDGHWEAFGGQYPVTM